MDGQALSLHDISKAFDGQSALDDARLDVAWGEVHALLGENGAGKSTLMNIVCGLYTADKGDVFVSGTRAHITKPGVATQLKIGMLHQHFKLVDSFSVVENVLLACGKTLGLKSVQEAQERCVEAAHRLGFDIEPHARTSDLSVAERQRIEIVKLILLGADILILDEPTAVLTDEESGAVLALLRELAGRGKAIVLITHRLREVTGYADRVTIMRAGKTIFSGVDAKSMSEPQLAEAMVGEALVAKDDHRQPYAGHSAVRLALDGVSVKRSDGLDALRSVSLNLCAGEILGVAGVGGNGQTELAEGIFGLAEVERGSIRVDGVELVNASVAKRREAGLRLVPADRFAYALLPDLKAHENLAITDVPNGRFGSRWWLRRGLMKRIARDVFATHDISGGTPNTRTRLLSGGNAQKLLLARELNERTSVLVVHSPTRGLDVRAYNAVHDMILASVAEGAACLLISEDLDEVLALATHVAALNRGVLHGPFQRADITRARVGELMAGHA